MLSLALLDPLWDPIRVLAGWLHVAILPKEGLYRAAVMSASRDHVPCMSPGDPPKPAVYMPRIPGGPTQAFGNVAPAGQTCLRSLSSRELEKTVPGEMDLSAEGKSIGLGVRPACVSHPGSATTGYVALGKWLNIIHM